MTSREVFDLIDRFEKSTIHTLKMSDGAFSIEMSRGAAMSPTAVSVQTETVKPVAAPQGAVISAPVVGTFYAASAPDATPFVAAGDKVKKGQTVCLIEAMKMLSEVPAPCDCVIEEVLKANGELVAFNEPIFRYQPCSGAY